MSRQKKIIAVSIVAAVVLVFLGFLAIRILPKLTHNQSSNSPSADSSANKITSSQFGQKVPYPNNYEGRVRASRLDSYVIGQYKSEHFNYDDLLANAEVVQKIAAIVDPSLTAARDNFPQAQVEKLIFNGFMTVRVNEYPKNAPGYAGDEMFWIPYGDPVYALNFDLRTGEKVDLRSVFSDGFDVQAAVDKAVQPYVLAHDEHNVRKFRGVDLNTTSFTLDTDGIWLIFSKESPYLSGKSIYVEWYKFGDGAIAVFDRFLPLQESEISAGDDYGWLFWSEYLYKSEPRYLVAQKTNFYLPTSYENDYERDLADKAKQMALKVPTYNGYPYESQFLFRRIGNYRVIDCSHWEAGISAQVYGIFNIQTQQAITLSEYYGDDYEKQVLEAFRELGKVSYYDHQKFTKITEARFLELLKTAEFNAIRETLTFSENIVFSSWEYHDGTPGQDKSDTLYVETKKEWWR